MKKLIFVVFLFATATVYAAGQLEYNANGTYPIQGFAPDGRYSALLTSVHTQYDLTNYAAFSVYCAADSKIRFTASTSRNGSVSETLPGGQYNTFVVSSATPFVSISSCTGVIRRSTPRP